MIARLWPYAPALVILAAVGCQKPVKPGDPVQGLSDAQLGRFNQGKEVFDSEFTPETGLGPVFNANGCGECHEDPVVGGVGDEVELHATAYKPPLCDPLAEEGGFVFQLHVTPALKAALGIDSEPVSPHITARAMRTSPVVFGRGFLDLVSDSTITSYADSADKDGDGISGRPNHFFDGRIGRFGRKALVPTLDEFNAGALLAEMSVTNPVVPTEETVGGKPIPTGVDPVPEPEIDQDGLDGINDFVRFLGAPTPLKANPQARYGRELFTSTGCAKCHIPTLVTRDSPVRALSHKKFSAYTDLLLHDMGPDLADACLGDATPAEFRTEPLMGLRVAKHFLHDGRATSLEQAVQLHGGEAAGVRDRFLQLPDSARAAVIAFLGTL
jgi:CxxC motif-containing protein (DUF1111 family)